MYLAVPVLKRQLRRFSTSNSAALNLFKEARRQLDLEITADASDPSARLPPLAPVGWAVHHTPGTRILQLSRMVTYGDLDKRECRGGLTSTASLFAGRPTGNSAVSDVEELLMHRRTRQVRLRRQLRSTDTYCSINIFSALAVQDWSFWDPNVRIGEWVPFDALISKPRDRLGEVSGSRVRRHMLLGFASADAQLRFRRLQMLTDEEASVIQSNGGLTGQVDGNTLMSCGGRGGFLGPNLGRLGKELTDNLLEYSFLLGIDGILAEFVCQMLHFVEHQEYLAWMTRLAEFSRQLAPPPPRPFDEEMPPPNSHHFL